MQLRWALAVLVLVPLALGQEKTEGTMVADAGQPEPPSVTAWRGTIRTTLERKGTFIPAEHADLKLEPKVYNGELKLTEILSHGSFVNEGDVIARLDTEGIDKKLEADRMALEQAEMGFRHLEENQRMKAEQDAEALAKAERARARAAKRMRGYREHEKKFDEENERLGIQGGEHRLEDQKDELDQLEKMYSEDELVDATEEIVLKRSRRNFARSKAYHDLSEQRRIYSKEWFYAWREEDLEQELDGANRALDRLKKSQAMGNEKAESDMKQKRWELEKQREKLRDLERDRELFTVRSPRRGILLHGAADAAPWPARLEKGGAIRAATVFATVADPKKFKVTTDIAEADLFKIKSGSAAEVVPTAASDLKLIGRLEVDFLPAKNNVFPATIHLGQTDLKLRPGLTCTVNVILEEERDAILVPKTALIEKDGQTLVRCRKEEGGPVEMRKVTIGICDGKNVAIKEGVTPGEIIILEPKKK